MKLQFFLVLLVLVSSAGAIAADAPLKTSPFTMKRDLVPVGDPAGEFGRVDLDADIFARSAADYSDLRVTDDQGKEVPVVIRPKTDVEMDERWISAAAKIESLKPLPGGVIEVILKRPDQVTAPIGGFAIRTSLNDFEKSVVIEGSGDGIAWSRLVDGAVIYDYHRFLDGARGTKVEISPSDHTHYRIRIGAAVEAVESSDTVRVRESRGGVGFSESETMTMRRRAFKLDGIDVLSLERKRVGQRSITEIYPVEDLRVFQDEKAKATIATFASRGIPLHGITLTTDSRRHDRPVVVEAKKDGDEFGWFVLKRAQIRSVGESGESGLGGEIHELLIAGGPRFEHYRITIADGDSPPLEGLKFSVNGIAHEGVFELERGRKYSLLYGAEGFEMPDYDLARVLGAAGEIPLVSFVLGDVQLNADFDPGDAPVTKVPGKTILTVILVAVALFLLLIVAKMVQAVDGTEGSGPNESG